MADLQVLSLLTSRAAIYFLAGLTLFALTLHPWLSRYRVVNMPLFYVLFGIFLGVLGVPVLDPLSDEVSSKIIEHASELIVIISLAGAGLAIDSRNIGRDWWAAIRLLALAMPLTILATALLGLYLAGLPLASALLLGAVLAPTDPVLARSVQVSPPGQGETPMEISLTAEAGLNDGLAFPFVYLAIAFAAASGAWTDWGWEWLAWDAIYRVLAGAGVGILCGWTLSSVIHSRIGDAKAGAWNALIVVLATTFISYGAAELVQGYGFLAVFFAARAGRAHGARMEGDYERYAHRDADQLEGVLLVLLLTWFGMFLTSGLLEGLRPEEALLGVLMLLVVRPLAGFLSLLGADCSSISRNKVAFFGIRGMGTVFYIAYAQNHAEFAQIEEVWRIAAVTIMGSIVVHGFAANVLLREDSSQGDGQHPHQTRLAAERAEMKERAEDL